MEKTAVNSDRRKFLAAVKYAGALGIVALLAQKARTTAPPQTVDAAEPPVSGKQYHETEHIRKYYHSAGLL